MSLKLFHYETDMYEIKGLFRLINFNLLVFVGQLTLAKYYKVSKCT